MRSGGRDKVDKKYVTEEERQLERQASRQRNKIEKLREHNKLDYERKE